MSGTIKINGYIIESDDSGGIWITKTTGPETGEQLGVDEILFRECIDVFYRDN